MNKGDFEIRQPSFYFIQIAADEVTTHVSTLILVNIVLYLMLVFFLSLGFQIHPFTESMTIERRNEVPRGKPRGFLGLNNIIQKRLKND